MSEPLETSIALLICAAIEERFGVLVPDLRNKIMEAYQSGRDRNRLRMETDGGPIEMELPKPVIDTSAIKGQPGVVGMIFSAGAFAKLSNRYSAVPSEAELKAVLKSSERSKIVSIDSVRRHESMQRRAA